ncbi:DUF1731 domain-containing protein [Streptomyces sp. NPDC056637]|uniref:DUF1731 domain-containing protein n=1 Tax=unclassified Streptomyces TaxID=2593676 RepID=UPI00369D3D22
MKIVIPGGTGQVGTILKRELAEAGHEVVVLTRRPVREGETHWDGETLGPWAEAVDGSDAVINLAGRSVSCRYTPANLRAMMDSRVRSAEVVGEAVAAAARPPELGAFALRSDTELLLKSRRVVPGRLLDAGFSFDHPAWPDAAANLARRVRGGRDVTRDMADGPV